MLMIGVAKVERLTRPKSKIAPTVFIWFYRTDKANRGVADM